MILVKKMILVKRIMILVKKITKEIQDLLSSRYPRLSSHSTYSLPRNTRLYKSCKRFVYILPKIHCIFE